MKRYNVLASLVMLMLLGSVPGVSSATVSAATEDARQGTANASVSFDSAEKKALYERLLDEYRCLKCQNQTIGDSAAELAGDLRRDVFNMVAEGKQEPEITSFLVSRYGDFVRYRPPFNAATLLLWLGPFVLLVVAAWFAWRQARQPRTTPAIDDADLHDARRLLREPGDDR